MANGIVETISGIFLILLIFMLFIVPTGLMLYPIFKNFKFFVNNKVIIFIISFIIFFYCLYKFFQNFNYTYDPNYNAKDYALITPISFLLLSLSSILIINT